jgi:hypothetical protein
MEDWNRPLATRGRCTQPSLPHHHHPCLRHHRCRGPSLLVAAAAIAAACWLRPPSSSLVGKTLVVAHHSGVAMVQPLAPRILHHYYSIVMAQPVGAVRHGAPCQCATTTFHSWRRTLRCATPKMRHAYSFGAPRLFFCVF